jgi:large subunit ribosomal protein L25
MAKTNESTLVAESRDVAGTAASRRLRRDGRIPGVINNEKGESQWIRLNRHDFELMLHRHVSENLILDLEVDGRTGKKVLLKEVQHDPLTGHVLHADFVEISMTRKMRIGISIRLVGEPVGVSQQGGILEHSLRTIEVECLPTDLVEEIDVDVSALEIGSSLLVRDLKVDPKLTVLTTGDLAVASVSAPRAEEVPAAEAAVEGAAPGEPEIVGEKGKKEEGEEAAAPAAAGAKKPAKEKE